MTRANQLSVTALVLMTIVSVDSIRNLPTTALFGESVVVFFTLAALFFLLPAALASGHLASQFPEANGVYHWVSAVLGPRAGLMAVWLQWIENVIWYPTILSFVAGSLGYVLDPVLAHEPWFLTATILVTFWTLTAINALGIRMASWLSHICTWLGLIVPMILIMGLGLLWWSQGRPMAIDLSWQHLMPDWHRPDLWVSLTGVMLSFCGVELTTVHANDVASPQSAFPRALTLASVIIWATLVLGSLAIACVLPHDQMSLVSGLMQTFDVFLSAYHLSHLLPLMGMMLILGGVGSVVNWIIAPTKGLALAAADGYLPAYLGATNRFGAPYVLLLIQAAIVGVCSLLFVLMPSINTSYWVMTVLASQLYMVMYIMLFVTCWRTRHRQAPGQGAFRLSGVSASILCAFGLVACLVTLVVGFWPPQRLHDHQPWLYAAGIGVGILVLGTPPLFMGAKRPQLEAP